LSSGNLDRHLSSLLSRDTTLQAQVLTALKNTKLINSDKHIRFPSKPFLPLDVFCSSSKKQEVFTALDSIFTKLANSVIIKEVSLRRTLRGLLNSVSLGLEKKYSASIVYASSKSVSTLKTIKLTV
jgi:hypothetical protein